MATINMLVGQKVTVAVIPTASGIDADITGIPTWTSANTTVLDTNPAADGLTCELIGKAAGSTTITVSAEGSSTLTTNHTVVVAAVSTNLATAVAITVQKPPA